MEFGKLFLRVFVFITVIFSSQGELNHTTYDLSVEQQQTYPRDGM